MESLKFIDFFAGIGGFRRGMELAGHECVGFCEFDKFAVASYTSMHLITGNQRLHLATLDKKKRQNEILKEEYRNGEWYTNDIRKVDSGSMPKSDCWCFGFPCQDISTAGKQLGFAGHRSSLFFAVTKLIRELSEEDRPTYLFIENVKNLLSVNGGFDFTKLLIELDEIGYDAEWQVLNSKNFGLPQNRERVFVVGHLRGRGERKTLPISGTSAVNGIKVIGYVRESKIKDRTRILAADGISQAARATDYKDPIKIAISATEWRRLTPKEYFRLQAWTDDYFEKAEFVNSDSQLYKQAGNGVTVSVIRKIAERLN